MDTRGKVVFRRTYSRPKNEEETQFETFEENTDRVIYHQQWLWERQIGRPLNFIEINELKELRELILENKMSTSGRTLWLGGTDIAKTREASQFNCSFTKVETVYDVVDVLWLLMQGCGVGFKPVVGSLTGFMEEIPEIEIIRSKRTEKGGIEHNVETFENGVWTIKIGDSAEAWSKSIGKLLAGKKKARKLVFDFSELRPAGIRLKGYGWISSGDEAIAKAYSKIAEILNSKAGQLLSKIDILDIVNWLGTILSSRRSAQIALFEYDKPEWEDFAVAKDRYLTCKSCKSWNWDYDNKKCKDCGCEEQTNPQRGQSNNSLLFEKKPTRNELVRNFKIMVESGGSEPAMVNAESARRRAPWFAGCNPCVEILLGNKTFCNLMEIDIAKFKGDFKGLQRALYIAGRANYRQTCVDLRDGILQEAWHLNNEFLRLCGVGNTGIAQRDDLTANDLEVMRLAAHHGAHSMAKEFGTQPPKNVTTVKPSGSLSKLMGTTEGVHKPLGKYIFNWINFGKNDPLLPILEKAGYESMPNPNDEQGIIVKFGIAWENVEFEQDTLSDGTIVEVNKESAVTQLNRYKKWQVHYCDQNVSNTISYSPDEVPEIIDWLMENWEIYIGVSFLFRADPTQTAEDLGYLYLPQEVTTKDKYNEYMSKISDVNFDGLEDSLENEISSQECAGGHCPVR